MLDQCDENGAEACQAQNEAIVQVVLTRHEYTAEIAVSDNGQTDAKTLENASVPLHSGKNQGWDSVVDRENTD